MLIDSEILVLDNQEIKFKRLNNQQLYDSTIRFVFDEENEEVQEKEINLQTEFDENIFIKTDSQLLELVFNNLLSNAFKFTSSKGSIFVSCTEKENNIIVEISDTGCGISSEVGDKIFNKFYQADTSHKSEGNGLGLALVKQIIDLLCGEISVRSQVGVGTTFLITLTK